MPKRYHDSEPFRVYAATGTFDFVQRIRTSQSAVLPAPDQYQGHVAPSERNEIQKLTVTGRPTGGSFTLTYGGNTTGVIPWNATAAQLETAILSLPSIGAGNIMVEGPDGGPWNVTFQGSLKNTNVPLFVANYAGLTGGLMPTVAVLQAQAGSPSGPGMLPLQSGRDDTMPNQLIIAEAPAVGMLNAEDGFSALIKTGVVSQPTEPKGAETRTRALWRRRTTPHLISGWQGH
jgi:hypothetical protein